jgi:myosin heavy subunit
MLAQLRYAGLLEVCRIRQLGYPNRMSFDKFMRLYLVLQPAATDCPSLAKLLQDNGHLKPGHYVLGNTKIFLKHEAAAGLDSARDAAYFTVVRRVQRVIRGFTKRRRFALFMKTLKHLKAAVASKEKHAIEEAVALAVDLPNEGNHLGE